MTAGDEARAGEAAHLRLTYGVALTGRHRGFISLSIVAVAALLVITSPSASFWRDDWTFIQYRTITDPASWFLPHAEHFVVVHAIVYTALLGAFGTGSYLPFLMVLFATHVAFVAAIYALVDRHVSRGPALASAAILLFLGSAALNLFWAFQMGAIASGALAMWAIVVIRERPWLAALLLGLAIATQGFALFMVPAAALYGWSRRAVLASAVPVAVYGAWYLLIGRGLMVHYTGPAPTTGLIDWTVGGLQASASALTGLGPLAYLVLLPALVLLLRVPDRRLATVGIVGLLTEYAILSLSRSGLNVPAGWQYIYFGAPLLLLVFASAWPAVPRWGRPAVAMLAGIALVSNALAIVSWSFSWPGVMAYSDPLCLLCVGP